ncbi:sensor histidine kinase [Klebsiella variicola]|uniref:sensor histidine kinase n=1 Tax=Klebsiella variicola TaxID=244366 RepID=UPI0034E02AEE
MKKLISSYAFDLSPRVPLQLGRESIANSTTAVTELVKNSYDADASKVSIKTFKLDKPISVMVIEDDGNGMDPETLISSWLKIGTDNKVYDKKSLNGRVLTGAKGLGRLGIDRLCRRLILQTKTTKSDHLLQLDIDWKKYEVRDKSFFDIKHNVFTVDYPSEDKYGQILPRGHGTRMILLGLKDDWAGYLYKDLAKELRLLVSPFFANDEFKIEMATDFDESQNLNSSEILDYSRWSAEASVNEDGSISAEYRYKNELVDSFTLPWNEWINNRNNIPSCGPLDVKLYYIPRESVSDIDLKIKQIRSFLDANQGVRIYRDNFRVRPYGEPSGKGDWLDLGLRKVRNPEGMRQGNWKVGPNQIVGAVFINRDKNSTLNDQANREGIVENESFYDLRTFILKVIEKFESLAVLQSRKESAPEKKIVIEELKEKNNKTNDVILEIQKRLNINIKNKNTKKSDLKHIAKNMLKVVEQQKLETEKVDQLLVEVEQLKDTMANLASLGILTVCLGHETKQHTSMSATNISMLREMIEEDIAKLDTEKALIRINLLENSIKYISDFAGFALSNVRPDKRNMNKLQLNNVINDVIKIFNQSLVKSNVEVTKEWDSKIGFPIRGYRIHWESIIINFLTNSLWALESTKEGKREIKIKLSLDTELNRVEMRFLDSGRGIEFGTENRVFDTGFSTKTDEKGDQSGTGMGLSIVKNFVVDNHKGDLTVIPKGELGGAEFVITVPVY